MKNFLCCLLDWIYKKRCYNCSSSKESLLICSKCYNELTYNLPQVSKIILGCDVYIAGEYTKILQKIIRGLKYHNKKELSYYLSKYMYEYFKTLNLEYNFQLIPVPLHIKRQKKRKYNHMELVAEEFSKMCNCTVNKNLIKRIKDTKPQYKLSKNERIKNLENAFEIDMSKYIKKPILIIDDISTSGATFESIIKLLQKNGITDITCFAASTPYN